MKKLLLFFTLFFTLFVPANANVMPRGINAIEAKSLGVYQVPSKITLYKEPKENADIVHSIRWNSRTIFPESVKAEDIFAVFIPSKSLALMTVTDEDITENWLEVIYNKSTGARAWIKKDDPYKFLTWVNFYNMYGKKYGLYMLKGVPAEVKELHSATDDKAQVIARVNIPQIINLNVIRGNWALVSVMDLDRMPKTGYMKWRDTDGVKYLFPAIK